MQHAGDRDVGVLPDQTPGIIDHHHGSVVEIGDTLVVFLAFLQNEDAHRLTRQHDGLQRIGKFVDVQDVYAAELCHLVEIEIVGNDDRVKLFPEFD